jgi:hypothetical protein
MRLSRVALRFLGLYAFLELSQLAFSSVSVNGASTYPTQEQEHLYNRKLHNPIQAPHG